MEMVNKCPNKIQHGRMWLHCVMAAGHERPCLADLGAVEGIISAAVADALERITAVLGEHPDTEVDQLVAMIEHIRGEARVSAEIERITKKRERKKLLALVQTSQEEVRAHALLVTRNSAAMERHMATRLMQQIEEME